MEDSVGVSAVTLLIREHNSLLTSCVLAFMLLANWLIINIYKAHIDALICKTICDHEPKKQS